MPVTAKLSRKFYERLGDDIADELVEWFNSVDATYRADLREFNELNFARFDAKLEQRLAQFEAKLEQRLAQFEAKFEQRLVQFEVKIEQRLAQFEAKVEVKIEQRLAQLEVHFERRLAETKTSILLWSFGFWITTLLAILGTRLL